MAIDSGAIVLNRFLSGERTLPAQVASAKTAADFASWLAPIVRKNWMVDCQGPPVYCLDSTAALKILARFVPGVAFHDERILSADEQGCVLRVKDYRHDTVGTLRLTPDEFVQRFTPHLLPRQLRRMRYAGMFRAGAAKKKLPLCRKLLLEHHTRAALTHASTLTASASNGMAKQTGTSWQSRQAPGLGKLVANISGAGHGPGWSAASRLRRSASLFPSGQETHQNLLDEIL